MSPASGFDQAFDFIVSMAIALAASAHPILANFWLLAEFAFLCMAFVFLYYVLPAIGLLFAAREFLKIYRNWPMPRSYDDWRP